MSKRVALAPYLLRFRIFPPSVFALFCVYCRSSEFLNWNFILEKPNGCVATYFIFYLLNVTCLLLLLLCSYFHSINFPRYIPIPFIYKNSYCKLVNTKQKTKDIYKEEMRSAEHCEFCFQFITIVYISFLCFNRNYV